MSNEIKTDKLRWKLKGLSSSDLSDDEVRDIIEKFLDSLDEIERLRKLIRQTRKSCEDRKDELESHRLNPRDKGFTPVHVNHTINRIQNKIESEIIGLEYALDELDITND